MAPDLSPPLSSARPSAPPGWIKAIISLLILTHLSTIVIVVSSAQNHTFSAPLPALKLHMLVMPYVRTMFLSNPYRFYAPDPGPTNMIWARFEYTNGDARWMEMPRRQDYVMRTPYQRYLALSLLVHTMFIEYMPVHPMASPESAALALTRNQPMYVPKLVPTGEVVISAYVRFLARQPQWAKLDGTGHQIATVKLFAVLHQIITPMQLQANWKNNDPRLYAASYVGAFDPKGRRLPGPMETDYLQDKDIDGLFALLVQDELGPYLEKLEAAGPFDLAQALERFGLPSTYRIAVTKDPSIVKLRGREDIRLRFVQITTSEDKPLEMHYPQAGMNPPGRQDPSSQGIPSKGAPRGSGPPGTVPSKPSQDRP